MQFFDEVLKLLLGSSSSHLRIFRYDLRRRQHILMSEATTTPGFLSSLCIRQNYVLLPHIQTTTGVLNWQAGKYLCLDFVDAEVRRLFLCVGRHIELLFRPRNSTPLRRSSPMVMSSLSSLSRGQMMTRTRTSLSRETPEMKPMDRPKLRPIILRQEMPARTAIMTTMSLALRGAQP